MEAYFWSYFREELALSGQPLVGRLILVSHMVFSTTCRATVILFGLFLMGVTKSAKSSFCSWPIPSLFFSATLQFSFIFKMGTSIEWRGTIILAAGCIDFINQSINVFPHNASMASLSTTPNMTQMRDSPIRRWRVMVPDTVNLLSNALRISGMLRW